MTHWTKVVNDNDRMQALYQAVALDKNVSAYINDPSLNGIGNTLVSNVIVAVCNTMKGHTILTPEQTALLNNFLNNASALRDIMVGPTEGKPIDPELNVTLVGDAWDEEPVKK